MGPGADREMQASFDVGDVVFSSSGQDCGAQLWGPVELQAFSRLLTPSGPLHPLNGGDSLLRDTEQDSVTGTLNFCLTLAPFGTTFSLEVLGGLELASPPQHTPTFASVFFLPISQQKEVLQ